MSILVAVISFVLLVLSAIHLLWGFGFWFPIRDEEKLVAAVVGARDVDRMPGPIPCAVVSALLLVVIIVLWGQTHWVRDLILWTAAVIFVARGLVSYSRFWRKITPREPFATNDRRYFGPLCLALGLGLVIVQLARA